MRRGNAALKRVGASKVRSQDNTDNGDVESQQLIRNIRPSTSSSCRFKLLAVFLMLLVGFQWFSESFARLGIIGLRTVVFPLVRPRCLPQGSLPPNASQLKFAVAQIYYPKNGPTSWSEKAQEMVEISVENKLKYCHRNGYAYFNGTEWAEENFNTLSKLGGPQPEMWFKPLYLQHLIRAFHENSTIDWILFMDMDTIVMNHDVTLTKLLAGTSPTDALIISPDAGGINAGVFMIATNEFGLEVINTWVEGITKHKTVLMDQDYLRSIFDDKGVLRKKNSTASLKVLRQCALQSTGGLEQGSGRLPFTEGTYARGDFCVHFFGRPDKQEQMRIASKGSLAFFSR